MTELTRRRFLRAITALSVAGASAACSGTERRSRGWSDPRLETRGQHTLLSWFPSLEGKLPRVKLLAAATPVQRLPELEDQLGASQIWIKRDDLASPLYGGNKVRKLEYLLGDAVAAGADHLVTMGGIGSHHCCATAIFGSANGIKATLVHTPQPVTDEVVRVLRWSAAFDVDLRLTEGRLDQAWQILHELHLLREKGARPYFIWAGGSTAIGTIGIVESGLELADQIQADQLPRPAAILVACGSAGTHAGLLAALKLAGLDIPVIGVRVLTPLLANATVVHHLANAALRILRQSSPEVPDVRVDMADVAIDPGYIGEGYGYATADSQRAVELVQGAAGIALETTYTGKTMAAALDRAHARKHEGPLLFWNTYNSKPPSRPLADLSSLPEAYRRYLREEAPTLVGGSPG